jgi:hypothetical protein
MTVYVDDARIPARRGRLSSTWSHLFADTEDELHEFEARLGLRRSWFQGPHQHRKAVQGDAGQQGRAELALRRD